MDGVEDGGAFQAFAGVDDGVGAAAAGVVMTGAVVVSGSAGAEVSSAGEAAEGVSTCVKKSLLCEL